MVVEIGAECVSLHLGVLLQMQTTTMFEIQTVTLQLLMI